VEEQLDLKLEVERERERAQNPFNPFQDTAWDLRTSH
jgi:hypothetical protein